MAVLTNGQHSTIHSYTTANVDDVKYHALIFWLCIYWQQDFVHCEEINQSISLIADLQPKGRIANEMQVK